MDNKGTIKLLKTAESQNRMKAIVVDEAHLVAVHLSVCACMSKTYF